jgi:hypothetical protein
MEAMSISKQVKAEIEQIQPGVIFGLKDFNKLENPQAVALELSRLTKKGTIQRLTKGKYFIPKKTKFGSLRPDEWQILDKVIKESGGYFAGNMALNRLGVTTQVPSQILIRGARSTRKLKVGSLVIQFEKTGNSMAESKDAEVTDLIEAARLIKRTPDGSIETTIKRMSSVISSMSIDSIASLIMLLNYERPYVRAILGSILENLGSKRAMDVRATLNPLSKYKIGIDSAILPNKERWGII